MTPGGHEYLTGSVGCADHDLEPGESMADYYVGGGYPPGEWIGGGAAELGLDGVVTPEQMMALFGEGRHPDADRIEAEMLAAGASPEAALAATKLGRRFPQYGGEDALRRRVGEAYGQHNLDHGRPIGAPLDADTRQEIRERVYVDGFAADHDGREPVDDAELRRWISEQKRALRNATAGYELVFAPDKSVSAAWALADPVTRELIADAHRQAVRDAIALFEVEVAFTRSGREGEAQVDVTGVTGAIFEHWDSRAGDPHLHSHVPVSAKVKRANDGKWTSLDGRTIYAAAVAVSEFYNSRYRDLLRQQGATFVLRPAEGIDLTRPVWQLEGMPDELITAWSQRAQQVEAERARGIVEFRHRNGREPDPKELLEISRRAQYGTRRAKGPPRSLAEHQSRWQAFADSIIGKQAREALVGRILHGRAQSAKEVDVAALANVTRHVVSEAHATFNRWNLTAEAHRQTAGLHLFPRDRDSLVQRVVETIIAQTDTVKIQAPSLVEEPAALRRSSGESVFIEHHSARYTTEQTLREEQEMVGFARRYGGHRLTADTIAAAVAASAARDETLNSGQERLVTEFARSGRRLQGALAPAGTGKTTAMRVFAEAWRSAGGRVFAFGPSARAAQELGDSISAIPHTLHQVPTALQHGLAERMFSFRAGDVLIIDEFAMAGTHTLHTVVDWAISRGADVRLIGDDHQLAAVEAGGFARLLARDVGVLRLHEVVRFRDPAQGAASLLIREGDPDGLQYYNERGWIASGSIETMRDAAHREWRADLDAGLQTLLIVPRNEDVISLNMEAHTQRVVRGHVDAARVARLHDGTVAGRGDWVVTRDNRRRFTVLGGKDFVKNGDTWTVLQVAQDGSLHLRHRAHQGRITVPADYVDRHVELAYVATSNRTQGMSVRDSAHTVVTPETTREQLYPGITRSMEMNRMYVVTSHHVVDSHRETPPEDDPLAVLTGVLRRSGVELSATEALREALSEAESLSTLVQYHEYAVDLVTHERFDRILHDVHPAAADADAAPALREVLRKAEAEGWQAERLLPAVANQRSLAGADDVAAVLVYRVENHVRTHQPPARVADPAAGDVERWRALVTSVVPEVDPSEQRWDIVWRHAAGGHQQGLASDAAVSRAAAQLASRPTNDPMDDHRFVAHAVVAELSAQRAAGGSNRPALPWLSQHFRAAVTGHAELQYYLRKMNSAIGNRVEELRSAVERERPRWADQLGKRPDFPALAGRWDRAAAWAAAWRETHKVTTTDPANPFGQRPEGNGLHARGWDAVDAAWRQAIAASPADHNRSGQSQQALEELRRGLRKSTAERAARSEDHVHIDDETKVQNQELDTEDDEHLDSGLRY
ncbi:MobF family relaxase [Saccharopolyspora elongata]|nr:MobF family relaxase [Saccharopolyspora elongata]